MGILDRLQAHFNQPSSTSIAPEEPLRGLAISSPAPPTASQRERLEYFRLADNQVEDAEVGVGEDGLPTYNHLFPDGPYRWFRDPPRPPSNPPRPLKDPRRLYDKEPRKLPLPVIGIMCEQMLDTSTTAILARSNHSIYDTVIPHLYRKMHIDRFTLPKVLYGIPLPISGFTFDPQAKFDAKGKQKQVYREEDVISRKVEERKRKCLEYVREIILEEPLLDWRICQSLLILRDPGYGRDASDTQPLGRFHPMREPEDPKAPSTSRPIAETTILMPKVETVYLTLGVVNAMEEWENKTKSPHILLEAIKALCGPKATIVTQSNSSSVFSSASRSLPGNDAKEATEQIEQTFEPGNWRPFKWHDE